MTTAVGEWIESGRAWPPLVHRDESPCTLQGKPIPPSTASDTVIVLVNGGLGIDRAFRLDGGQPNWFIHGDAVEAWLRMDSLPTFKRKD